MPNFRRFLSRRWLLVFAVVFVIAGVPMLHPYPRQSLFGPTLRGKPRCFWEAELRNVFDEPITELIPRLFGLESSRMPLDQLFDHPEMLPLVLELLDDPERHVREHALARINMHRSLQDPSALLALRKRLADDDLNIRLHAAQAIWRIDRDEKALDLIVRHMKDKEWLARFRALNHAASLPNTPELFPRFVEHAKDPESQAREAVMWGLRHHGKQGVPILMDGLGDMEPKVRLNAARSLGFLKQDAADAVPTLQRCLKDPDPELRRHVDAALTAIDGVHE